MFWGLIMEPKRRYFQKVTRPFHISMASMDLFACTKEPVQLMVHFQSRNYLLCTLQKSGPLQVRLDLNFEAGDEVSFTINGQSHVHLSGYHLEDDYVDVDSDDEGEEEEEEVEDDKQVEENVEEVEVADVSLSNIVYGKRKQTKSEAASSLTPQAKRSKTLELLADVVEGSDDDEDDEDVTFSDMEDDDDDDGETTVDSIDDGDLEDDDDDGVDDDDEDSSFVDLDEDGDEDGEEEQEDEEAGEDDSDEELEKQLVEKKLTKKEKNKQKQQANNLQSPQKPPEKPKKQQKEKQNKKGEQPQAKKEQPQSQSVNGTPTSEKKKRKRNKKQQNESALNTTAKDTNIKQEQKTPKSEKKQQNASPKTFVDRGVVIEEIVVGGGNAAKNGKIAHVYYEGRLKQSKKMFDNCSKGPPFKFRLGASEVIKGWDVGVAGMKIGGKRRITVPPQLAYGAKGVKPDIPSNAALVFDIELKNVS